jgi:hypothetical protein
MNHKIHEKTGYADTRFPGKEQQLAVVIKALQSRGFIPADLVENEVSHLYCSNIRLAGFITILALMMSISLRNRSTPSSIIFFRFMVPRSLHSLAMTPISRFVLIVRKPIMRCTSIPLNLVYPISQVHNTSSGISVECTDIALILDTSMVQPQQTHTVSKLSVPWAHSPPTAKSKYAATLSQNANSSTRILL